LLTLYTRPVIYIWFDKLASRFSKAPEPATEKPRRGNLGSEPVPAE
jgi:hypothetical protein